MIPLAFARHCTLCVLGIALVPGCVTVDNSPGRSAYYIDPTEPHVSTLKLDSQDIIAAARTAVPDMLACESIAACDGRCRLAVDAKEFRNLSLDPTAVQAFSGRLRTELQRTAKGRLVIINPERGRGPHGKAGEDVAPQDYDYCLGGEITSTLQHADWQGRRSSSYQILFELYEPVTREIVWSKPYDIKKVAQEPLIYR
jgi:hypothetical protein